LLNVLCSVIVHIKARSLERQQPITRYQYNMMFVTGKNLELLLVDQLKRGKGSG